MAKVVKAQDLTRATSARDSRVRVDLVTKELFGTTDLKADMVTYRPGDTAAPHRHPDAKHFFFVTEGEGILHVDDDVLDLRSGDVVMILEDEVHWFENRGGTNFSFYELWVPAPEGATVWVTDDQ